VIGQVIGDNRYQLRQQLGKKAGRQTWLAWDNTTQEEVVLKLLTFSPDFAWDDLKLFEREAETLRSLDHPCIPTYRDFFEFAAPSGQGFALVQDYVAARSLEAHLQAGRSFSEADVRQLAEALLEILISLHSRHPPLIHRDIKPSNILLTDRSGNSVGQVYLVDFGSVQTLLAKESGTITIVGTYGYMPPEQFGGQASRSADLYSLGATLIYLLSGRHPADIPQHQFRLHFEPLIEANVELIEWLGMMIEPDLLIRFATAELALKALREPVRQPQIAPSSRVKLASSPDHLTIEFPKVASITSPWLKRFPMLINFHQLWLIIGALAFSIFGLKVTLIGFIVGQAIFYLITRAILPKPGPECHILSLDRQTISLAIVARRQHRIVLSNPRAAITRLEYESESYRTAGAVRIWAGQQVYEVGGDRSLSTSELRWLAQELSQWLRLPIQQPQWRDVPPDERLVNPVTTQPAGAKVIKPAGSQVVLLTQLGWIEVLMPELPYSTPDPVYRRLFIDGEQIQISVVPRLVQSDQRSTEPPPSLRQAITAVEYCPAGDRPACVKIWAGKRSYELGGNGSLSTAELQWIAQEVSNWLQLPIVTTAEQNYR
jgi:serine/threonine protein kinase